MTQAASRRFFRFAFEYSRAAGRKQVVCVHKANILKMADGLFLEAFRETARDFPELQTRELIVDNCAMQIVSRPHQFDVLVMGSYHHRGIGWFIGSTAERVLHRLSSSVLVISPEHSQG